MPMLVDLLNYLWTYSALSSLALSTLISTLFSFHSTKGSNRALKPSVHCLVSPHKCNAQFRSLERSPDRSLSNLLTKSYGPPMTKTGPYRLFPCNQLPLNFMHLCGPDSISTLDHLDMWTVMIHSCSQSIGPLFTTNWFIRITMPQCFFSIDLPDTWTILICSYSSVHRAHQPQNFHYPNSISTLVDRSLMSYHHIIIMSCHVTTFCHYHVTATPLPHHHHIISMASPRFLSCHRYVIITSSLRQVYQAHRALSTHWSC